MTQDEKLLAQLERAQAALREILNTLPPKPHPTVALTCEHIATVALDALGPPPAEGRTVCPDCGGTGFAADSSLPCCQRCGGSGYLAPVRRRRRDQDAQLAGEIGGANVWLQIPQ